mmetsp:Transcript_81764/g.226485  ORF Transcript_81764/g.226485 Transcript_81764/m.226485 type:complete len:430 (-) Transcript_81764:738-2027(-)
MPIFLFSRFLRLRRLEREDSEALLDSSSSSRECDPRRFAAAAAAAGFEAAMAAAGAASTVVATFFGFPLAAPTMPEMPGPLSTPGMLARGCKALRAAPAPLASSLSDSGAGAISSCRSSAWSILYMRSLAQSLLRSICRWRSVNSARTSLGGPPCVRPTRSAGTRRCLQNWCHAWRHSSSPASRPLRTSRCRARAFDQSILRCTSLAGACVATPAPTTADWNPPASIAGGIRRRTPAGAPELPLSSASPSAAPAPTEESVSFALPELGAPAREAALGFVPTALKASAATASQRNRTTPSRSRPNFSTPWLPLVTAPSSSRTSKASSRPRSFRSVAGSKLCGGHSLRQGCPRSPSSGPRCATKSRKVRARGQLTIGHWCNSSCSCGFDLPPVSTGWTGAVALLSAETRRTCRSSFSRSAARLAARQSVAL